MSRFITIATVTAPPFVEFPESPFPRNLTPRLHLRVNYDEGNHSRPRAYTVSVEFDRLSDDGYVSVILMQHKRPIAIVEVAKRFSQAKLDNLADSVRRGDHNETVERLYDIAVNQHHEHHWPLSILPAKQLIP